METAFGRRTGQFRRGERFYPVDRARSRETGGTGHGLSIVKHIVQAHDGQVAVKGEPGQGALFHFTLPRASRDPVTLASRGVDVTAAIPAA